MSAEKAASTNNEVRFKRGRRVGHVFLVLGEKYGREVEMGRVNPSHFLSFDGRWAREVHVMARQGSYVTLL